MNWYTLVWPVLLAQVLPTDFFPQYLVLWNLFKFSVAEITHKLISPTF
jgi:hypothetical protein